jgi:hypothetical protein
MVRTILVVIARNRSDCCIGDIIYARLLNKPLVVVNSEEVARDVLELRSGIYSDRPQSIVYEPWVLSWRI